MVQIKIYILLTLLLTACMPKEKAYHSPEDYPSALQENLWISATSSQTEFKIWSPAAEEIKVILYPTGNDTEPIAEFDLREGSDGIWAVVVKEDLRGKYYTFQVKINKVWLSETPGIYAKAVGVNGNRAMLLDFSTQNPAGWEQDSFVKLDSPNSAVIYEMHIRDFTVQPDASTPFPGKYKALTAGGTVSGEGLPTGLDHLKELGVTHVHLLPVFDFRTIDESSPDTAQYNWGYDPQNYNVPEGSYSTDPFHAEVRIKEFKEMVMALHRAGIGVIMDVVYNHTGKTEGSNFNLECPDYYYRKDKSGNWSNASGCGNETASERPMMRKFMLESVRFWQDEYHIDGFRFDLMGIHDIETMNLIADELKEVNPASLVYGEGWTAGATTLPEEKQALKRHAQFMRNVSVFNDDLRDGIKGSVFEDTSCGFVNGAAGLEESIKFGVIGAILHDDMHYKQVNYSDTTWAIEPWQSVNYVSCHDNLTLYDKLNISRPDASEDELQSMQMLALGIVLTSQGIPFLHAGSEMLRTKKGNHNSYNLPDAINQIDWSRKSEYYVVFEYVRKLIQLRKDHPAFRLPTSGLVRKHLTFLPSQQGMVAFTLTGVENDSWKEIVVVYNSLNVRRLIELSGEWEVIVSEGKVNSSGLSSSSNKLDVPPLSLFIAFKK